MRRYRSILQAAAAVAIVLTAAPAYAAAADYYLKLGGLAASSDKPRLAVLEVQSWSWGVRDSGAAATAPAKPFTLTKPLPSGSVRVKGKFSGCSVGDRYPELELGGRTSRTYRVADAVVSVCGAAAAGQPVEEVSFNYSKLQF